jgi:hypothetical protein
MRYHQLLCNYIIGVFHSTPLQRRRLANWPPFTHNRRKRNQFVTRSLISIIAPGGIHGCRHVQDWTRLLDAGDCAFAFVSFDRSASLYPRGAAGVLSRRVSPVRRCYSRRRPRHRLHDPETVRAQSRLPGVFQVAGAGSSACGDRAQAGPAGPHHAGNGAKAG